MISSPNGFHTQLSYFSVPLSVHVWSVTTLDVNMKKRERQKRFVPYIFKSLEVAWLTQNSKQTTDIGPTTLSRTVTSMMQASA